jgi:hypothetical protein
MIHIDVEILQFFHKIRVEDSFDGFNEDILDKDPETMIQAVVDDTGIPTFF